MAAAAHSAAVANGWTGRAATVGGRRNTASVRRLLLATLTPARGRDRGRLVQSLGGANVGFLAEPLTVVQKKSRRNYIHGTGALEKDCAARLAGGRWRRGRSSEDAVVAKTRTCPCQLLVLALL